MKRWRLIKERRLRGWTQEILAQKINITISMVSMIENGSRNPSLKTAFSLARLFGIPTDELFANTDSNKKERD